MCNYSILSTITRFVNSNVTSDELLFSLFISLSTQLTLLSSLYPHLPQGRTHDNTFPEIPEAPLSPHAACALSNIRQLSAHRPHGKALAADPGILAHLYPLCRVFLPLSAVSVQQRHHGNDRRGHAHGAGSTGICSLPLRRMRTDATLHVSLLALGHPVVLAGRFHLSGNSDGPHPAETQRSLSSAPLLSAVCQSGTQRV